MSVYKAEPDKHGDYIHKSGQRYIIVCCRRYANDKGINVGWTEAHSLEDFAASAALRWEPLPEPPSD